MRSTSGLFVEESLMLLSLDPLEKAFLCEALPCKLQVMDIDLSLLTNLRLSLRGVIINDVQQFNT